MSSASLDIDRLDSRGNAVYERSHADQEEQGAIRKARLHSGKSHDDLTGGYQVKVQATMEAVTGLRTELRSEIQALRTELSRRIDVLELAVRQNSADIREIRAEIREMREDIRQNTEEIRSMREELERKADHEALLKLQGRVEVLERRLGIQ